MESRAARVIAGRFFVGEEKRGVGEIGGVTLLTKR